MKQTRKVRFNLSGVLLLDKGLGESSNRALQQIKRLLRAQKTGHTGTLDPLATGLLPLMFGEATKFAADLIDADKEYEAVVRLGYKSSTGDQEGELTAATPPSALDLSDEALNQAALSLTGVIEQVPPMFSALKKDGKPLYAYAREGVEIERKPRQVSIKLFEILERTHQPDAVDVRIKIVCSKGTYVRTLGEDFAKALGTEGHLTALRRTAVGRLRVADALNLSQIERKLAQPGIEPCDAESLRDLLAPVDSLLSSLPSVNLSKEQAVRFRHGQRLPLSAQGLVSGRSRIYGTTDQQEMAFLGTGILETDGDNALLRPERLIQEKL